MLSQDARCRDGESNFANSFFPGPGEFFWHRFPRTCPPGDFAEIVDDHEVILWPRRIAGLCRPRLGVPEKIRSRTSMMSSTFTLSPVLPQVPRDALRQRFSELEHPPGIDHWPSIGGPAPPGSTTARSLSITTPPTPTRGCSGYSVRFSLYFARFPPGTLRVDIIR